MNVSNAKMVATARTACGIETTNRIWLASQEYVLQQRVPLAVLKLKTLSLQLVATTPLKLQQRVPLAVLKLYHYNSIGWYGITVATARTACGIETGNKSTSVEYSGSLVATARTACGIETTHL